MKRLPVIGRLSHEQIDRHSRGCTDAAEKSRWHVLWLAIRPDQPLSATAAKLVEFTPAWGRAILNRYNAHGPRRLGRWPARQRVRPVTLDRATGRALRGAPGRDAVRRL